MARPENYPEYNRHQDFYFAALNSENQEEYFK